MDAMLILVLLWLLLLLLLVPRPQVGGLTGHQLPLVSLGLRLLLLLKEVGGALGTADH